MKYRVRIDMSFEREADAKKIFIVAQASIPKAVNINSGLPNEEVSFCEMEECGHEDASPCKIIEKWEVGHDRVI